MYVEPWLFGAPRVPDEVIMVDRRAVDGLHHGPSAQALSAVADAYLDECERRRDWSTRTAFCEHHR